MIGFVSFPGTVTFFKRFFKSFEKSDCPWLVMAILICLFPSFTQAQNINPDSDKPLEITADGSLEWNRNNKTFLARKNAVAKQGNVSLHAQIITAYYREGKQDKTKDNAAAGDLGGDMEIWQITANDGVTIHSQETTAYGQKAVYNLDSGLAVMTGSNLKLVSPDQTVTAKERFEYWANDGRLVAIGRPRVTRPRPEGGQDTLDADKVSAMFTENAEGERVLHSLEAIGNVVITTQTEVVTGSYAIYRAASNVAALTGGVKIRRGPNILEGEKAQVDLNTNISKMFGSPGGGGRVRGIFYPGSEEKPQ